MPSSKYLLLLLTGCLSLGGGLLWYYRPLPVKMVKPHRGEAIRAIYATGVVEPGVTLAITPRQSGHLIELTVDEGDTVHKGQILARLNDNDLQSTVKELSARQSFAQSYYRRLAELDQRNLVAKLDLDRARADLRAADAAVKRADAQRDFMTLTAPADGLIIRRDGEIGQFINPGQAIFHLSCCAPLRVSAQVDEEDIAQVYIGQPVLLHTDDLPQQILHAQISEITPKGDPITRSYRVRMQLDDPGQLKIGMTIDTNLLVEQHPQALLIPTQALDKQSVWLIEADKLRLQTLTLGISGPEFTEVLQGLDEQATLALPNEQSFQPGQRVRIKS